MLLDHNEWMAYWEDLASRYRPINHGPKAMAFARVIDSSRSPFQPYYYTDEFIESLRDDMNFPCLVVESTRAGHQQNSGIHAIHKCGIVVLIDAEKSDYDEENTAVDKCKKHCEALMAKLMADLKETPQNGHLDKGSILIHPIGPVNREIWGARVEFTIRVSADCNFVVDPDVWQPEEVSTITISAR